MPKYRARADANQPAIVKALRAEGYSVLHLFTLGKGCPDILVGKTDSTGGKHNYLFEIKDGDKPPSKRKLTPDEETFFAQWKGQTHVVKSPDDALMLMSYATPADIPPWL